MIKSACLTDGVRVRSPVGPPSSCPSVPSTAASQRAVHLSTLCCVFGAGWRVVVVRVRQRLEGEAGGVGLRDGRDRLCGMGWMRD
jgi:hypothetical protein